MNESITTSSIDVIIFGFLSTFIPLSIVFASICQPPLLGELHSFKSNFAHTKLLNEFWSFSPIRIINRKVCFLFIYEFEYFLSIRNRRLHRVQNEIHSAALDVNLQKFYSIFLKLMPGEIRLFVTEKNCILNGWALEIGSNEALAFGKRLQCEAVKSGFRHGVEWFTKGFIHLI